MAALDVVHRRLGQVGLGDQCLELHSGKANKKDVLSQLGSSLSSRADAGTSTRDVVARDVDEIRDRLNAYVESLHAVRRSGESVFEVLSRLIGLGAGTTVDLSWARIADTTSDTLDAARRLGAETQASAAEAVVGPSHPLRGIGHQEFSPLWEEQAEAALALAIEDLERLSATSDVVRDALFPGGGLPSGDDRPALLEALRLLTSPPPVTRAAVISADWTNQRDHIRDACAEVERVRSETLPLHTAICPRGRRP